MLDRSTPPTRLRAPGRLTAALLLGALVATGTTAAAAADLPDQEPGVTLRTFQLAQDPGSVCTLKSGQTPNVDKLMPTIDWNSPEQFGASDQFISQVTAHLATPTTGQYAFRVTNDDGALVYVADQLVVENDGPNDSTSVEGNATLTAGTHPLRVEYYEGAYGERLTLEWKKPGDAAFSVIPESALSTDANVVRVTAPGFKYCEGATDTAGDGLRLDTVNPDYELTDLRPEGFEPMVSALDFDAQDRLVVATSGSVSPAGWVPDFQPGEVFVLDGVTDATGPEDVTVTKIADDLLNPMGLEVVEDSIFVSERDKLTRLSDPDGDGFYDQHDTLATWPYGGKFHEFAFGLIHDEDFFYVNLSVSIDNGGATTNPQPAQNRGTTIKIDRATGEISYVASGLRTPNGIAFGPEGDLFAMDNQGGWLPASKLVHVEQGKFFNHYTNPPGPFDDQPVSAPALWLPQNEIANSPSTPILLQDGPFAGQMMFGDVTYGGLQRGFLEEVDGEYQGAVFRHSAGLEAGVNRVIQGPDGAFYVGGIGEGGNWAESGKLKHGLQKLTPVNEDSFDMLEMRVVEGGFEIEYTHPVSDEVVANLAESYELQQWRYVPTQQYGGPKVDEQPLFVTGATVSQDRTTVSIQVDGLKPGYVVHLRSPRPFASDSGAELLSTEAWYTLNSLPGYVAPADRGWYEAEEAQPLGGSSLGYDHTNYSGSGFAAGMQDVGSGRQFSVNVDEAGTYPLNLRYANGIHPFPELRDKDVSLYVNGERVGAWTLPTTGDWKIWGTATRDVQLVAGANTIAIQYDEGDEGNVNMDVLSIGSTDICTPADVEEGYTGLFDGTLASLTDWRLAGPGSFGRQDDCSIRTEGGLGLLWYTADQFEDYSLKLDWKLVKDDNGGVFVGFPDPGNDPWVGVNQGYEIQVDASDEPDRTTGAVYTFQGADPEAVEGALNPVGQWNGYDIRVEGERIRIYLNDVLVNDFTSTDPARDLAGFVGVQNHGGGDVVSYRNIRVKEITGASTEVATADVTVDHNRAARIVARVTGGSTAPTGTIEVRDGATVLDSARLDGSGKGVAIIPAGIRAPGAHELTVVYSGDATHEASEAPMTLIVNKIRPTVTANGTTYAFGQSRAVRVRLSSVSSFTPSGTVTISKDSEVLATQPVNGTQVAVMLPPQALAVGTQDLTVAYSGDDNLASVSATTTVGVTKAASSVSGSPDPAAPVRGQAVSLAVSVSGADGVGATGQVRVQVGGGSPQTLTLESGSVTAALGSFATAGLQSVRVTYLGSDVLLGSGKDVTFRVRR